MKQFKWAYDKVGGIKPVVIDGGLYVIIALCAYAETTLKGDDSYKYMAAWLVWYSKGVFGFIGAGALALKMFRDKSYANHREATDAKEALNLPDSKQTITEQKTTIVETKPTNEKTETINPTV